MSIVSMNSSDVAIFSIMVSAGMDVMEVLKIDTHAISEIKKPVCVQDTERYIKIIENQILSIKHRIHILQNIVDQYSRHFQYVTDINVLETFHQWRTIFLEDIECNRDFLNYFLMEVTISYLDQTH